MNHLNKKQSERLNKRLLSEKEHREYTMGCFYQDELRENYTKIKQHLANELSLTRKEVIERIIKLIDSRTIRSSHSKGDFPFEITKADIWNEASLSLKRAMLKDFDDSLKEVINNSYDKQI